MSLPCGEERAPGLQPGAGVGMVWGAIAPASSCPSQSRHCFLSHCLTSPSRNPQKQNPFALWLSAPSKAICKLKTGAVTRPE